MTSTLTPPAAPPRRPASPLRTELRRGLAPWAGLAVAGAALLVMAAKSAGWQGGWAETQSLLRSVAALVAAPLAVAAGCRQGGREHRLRTGALLVSASRGRVARTAVAAAPAMLWTAAGYTLAHGVSLLACLPYASHGRPAVTHVAADAVLVAAATGLGFVAGRLSPWRPTAPVLALCTYLVLALPRYDESSGLRFLSPALRGDHSQASPVWWQAPVDILWTGGLAATALVAHAARRKYLALVPLAVAVAAGTLITQNGERLWQQGPPPAATACTSLAGRQICVQEKDRGLLPEVAAALRTPFDKVKDLPGLPVRYATGTTDPPPGEGRLFPLQLGWSVTRGEITDPGEYARGTLFPGLGVPTDCTVEKAPAADRTRYEEAQAVAYHWVVPLNADLAGPHAPISAFERFAALPEPDRGAWLSQYVAAARACDLTGIPAVP